MLVELCWSNTSFAWPYRATLGQIQHPHCPGSVAATQAHSSSVLSSARAAVAATDGSRSVCRGATVLISHKPFVLPTPIPEAPRPAFQQLPKPK